MSLIAAIMFTLAFAPSVASAQEIPDYDSQAYCERVAANATKPDAMRGRCLWLAEYALDELETFWPRANARVREDCVETASAEESYAVLARCVLVGWVHARLCALYRRSTRRTKLSLTRYLSRGSAAPSGTSLQSPSSRKMVRLKSSHRAGLPRSLQRQRAFHLSTSDFTTMSSCARSMVTCRQTGQRISLSSKSYIVRTAVS
jgi:hypothetical protein